MRRPCREVKRFIESGAERLPEALQAHLQQCARCQHALRLEQAYQRALHAARSESMPACDLPWTRIQAQLASRAVARRAPLWHRYAYAGSLAVALFVASLAWLNRAPQAMSDAQRSELNPAVSIQSTPQAGESLALPSPEEYAARPPAPQRAASDPPKPRKVARARISTPTAPIEAAAPTIANAQPTAEMAHHARPLPATRNEPSPLEARIAGDTEPPPNDTALELAFRVAPNAEPFTVASLPLSQYELYNSSQVEYLPVRYGTPSSKSYNEGNRNDAIICSF